MSGVVVLTDTDGIRKSTVATAPVRICDAGGWTDTWFARHGVVSSLAVRPGVRVRVTPSTGDTYAEPSIPLVAAAVAEAGVTKVSVEVTAGVPMGSSLGTSAALTVAVLAALGVPRREIAARAHRVETERLGLQSGVQDQVAAAHGGASRLEIDYPRVRRRPIAVPVWRDLDRRLLTVFVGPHSSSAVHDKVIAELAGDASALDALRRCATEAADALAAGDLRRYGAALIDNTEAQRALHADLVSAEAQAIIDAARSAGALGWKVNGAGGAGGSVTVLCGAERPAVPVGEVLHLRLSRQGVRVTSSRA